MNKNIILKKNCVLLFILNIFILLFLILFRTYFLKLGYSNCLINIMFIIDIIIFIIGIVWNIVLLRKPNKYDETKSIILICVLFVIYLLVNMIGVVIINKTFNNEYKKTSDKLLLYCDIYPCDKYETTNDNGVKDFIIYKTYLDYNGMQNNIEIHTKYDSNGVLSVEANIYSQNEMFSEKLIKEQIEVYYSNFNVMVDETLIKKAFDNRFNDSVKKDNLSYKVNEVYEDGELINIKTTITLKLK